MTKHNPDNERIKRDYFRYLKNAKSHSEPTIDAAAKALNRFEGYTGYRDFRLFHLNQAMAFKDHLAEQLGQRSGKKLSKATLYSTFRHLRAFFQWLSLQPGYKKRIQYSYSEYFNFSLKDARVATAQREQKAPTLDQVRNVIATMPTGTDIERRNRALVAFTLLTGARDRAIASMKLKHVDLRRNKVFQDAREVQTKFGKTFDTYFFPVGDEIRQIVAEWIAYLAENKLFGDDEPLFPATRVVPGPNQEFGVVGLTREHWSNANPIRAIFREAFIAAGFPYFNPHSFRRTLVRLGQKLCKTPEAFKAWSQNLGHESPLTTFLSYGEVETQRQGEIIRQLGAPQPPGNVVTKITDAVTQSLIDSGLLSAKQIPVPSDPQPNSID